MQLNLHSVTHVTYVTPEPLGTGGTWTSDFVLHLSSGSMPTFGVSLFFDSEADAQAFVDVMSENDVEAVDPPHHARLTGSLHDVTNPSMRITGNGCCVEMMHSSGRLTLYAYLTSLDT